MGTLVSFLRQQKKVRKPEARAKRRREWLRVLNAFFQEIQSWLEEAQQEKLIHVERGERKLTEEALGTYTAPCLTLTVGEKTITLRPIGFTIIGADGRVDMESSNGTYMFLYVADRRKWVHGVGMQPAAYPELTEELFTNLMKHALA